MIKLIYAHNGKTIKRMNIKLNDYAPGLRRWDEVDYEPFKRWLCDKYGYVYEAVDWRCI